MTPQYVFPAYEDALYYLWRERKLPANVDPFESKLEDPLERARLAKVFSAGLDSVIGHVLPIARSADESSWKTGPWFLRAERCYLIPGRFADRLSAAAGFAAVGEGAATILSSIRIDPSEQLPPLPRLRRDSASSFSAASERPARAAQ